MSEKFANSPSAQLSAEAWYLEVPNQGWEHLQVSGTLSLCNGCMCLRMNMHTSFSSPQWFHVSPSVYTHRSVCFLGPRLACHCSSCRWMAPPRQWEQTFLITKPTPTHLPQCQLSQNPTTEKHRKAINCNGKRPKDCLNLYRNSMCKTEVDEPNNQRKAWIERTVDCNSPVLLWD